MNNNNNNKQHFIRRIMIHRFLNAPNNEKLKGKKKDHRKYGLTTIIPKNNWHKKKIQQCNQK